MNNIRFAWVISVVATLGSLYWSEIAGFIPCNLCWWQRIFMYPMSIIMGIALYKNDTKIISYILPMPIIGLTISVIHYLKQKVEFFSEIIQCDISNSCGTEYIDWFGFITIPFLAGIAFLMILLAFIVQFKKNKKSVL